MKRVFDVAAAVLGLLGAAPLLLGAAIAIRLDSDGPTIFRQERVGRNGTPFVIFKFRSMTVTESGLSITSTSDTRITKVGRLMRQYKIDELPQLINVLRGEMSIVGPRPEVEKYVALFPEEFEPVLRVRPGLTDPASLAFRHEEALLAESSDPEIFYTECLLPRKLELSSEYIAISSLTSDLAVIGRTALAVIRPTGDPYSFDKTRTIQ